MTITIRLLASARDSAWIHLLFWGLCSSSFAEGPGLGQFSYSQSQLFQLMNHACYPAVAVRNGFGEDGLPTGMIFLGKPFSETVTLTLAKAYQDSTEHHMKTPDLVG